MADLLNITMGELLQSMGEQFPDHEALVYPDLGVRYTYKQFNEICDQLAKGFISLGIQKGDHVAIWATNQPEWVISQFSTAKMGAVLVTVNTNYRVAELEYLLRQSDTTTLVLMESYRGVSYIEILYKIVPELRDSTPGQLQSDTLPFLRNVILLGDKPYPGTFLWSDVVNQSDAVTQQELNDRKAILDPDDVINMQYTSGTTGFPKGVMLSHQNIVNNARNIAECMNLSEHDRMCIPVPFFHTFGCVLGTLTCVSVGAAMVPVVEFDPATVLRTVEVEQCTALHGVPTMFIAELNLPDFDRYRLSTLRTGIMAGSPCPMEVMKAVIEKMGASEITIAYGLTESSPVITQTRPHDPIELRVSSVGRVLDRVEAKIVSPGSTDEVKQEAVGELCTRGYHVMKGYYKNAEATSKAIDEDGWLHTGDLAVVDENGYYRITGRLKDMIIRGGENIYPREIEEFLYTHPKILDVQVVGVPDERYGEEVMAFIRLRDGESISIEEIRSYCSERISRHKVPRYIHVVDSFPLTASGKIQKFKLREQGISLLG